MLTYNMAKNESKSPVIGSCMTADGFIMLKFQHNRTKPNLRWLPRVIVKHPPYRARVRKGNVVNSSISFPRGDLPEWVLLK